MIFCRQTYKFFFTFVLAISSSVFSTEETQIKMPDPLNLSPSWWNDYSEKATKNISSEMERWFEELRSLERQAPSESQEVILSATSKIEENFKKYLDLREIKGWQFEEAPAPHESYSIEEFLSIAGEVKESELELSDISQKKERLERIIAQARGREDELFLSYMDEAKDSLQRLLKGLNLLVATSSRVILDEKLRICLEKQAGIEKRLEWQNSIFDLARNQLSFENLDENQLSIEIEEGEKREKQFMKEFLQTEAELLSNGSTDQLDNQSIAAIQKLISYSRDRIYIIQRVVKRELVHIFKSKNEEHLAERVLQNGKIWLSQLAEIRKRKSEWESLIRLEKEAAEKALAESKEKEPTSLDSYLSFELEAQDALRDLEQLDLERFQTAVLTKLLIEKATENLHWLWGILERSYLWIEWIFMGTMDSFSYPIIRMGQQPISIAKLFQALIIFVFAYFLSKSVQKALSELVKRSPHITNASLYAFNRVAHYVFLSVGLLIALSFVGIDFSSFLILAGALSVGIGFGLQGIVNNFLGGLIVLFDRKIRVNDFIELSSGEMGHITEVNVQNTVIRTLTGHDILVPNSEMITRQLTNWTLRDPFARLHLPFGVAYGTKKEKVSEAVERAAENVEESVIGHKTLPNPRVWLVGFGDSSLNFELVVWVDLRKSKKRQSSLRAAYYWEIEEALRSHKLEIPFPQRDIHIKEKTTT